MIRSFLKVPQNDCPSLSTVQKCGINRNKKNVSELFFRNV